MYHSGKEIIRCREQERDRLGGERYGHHVQTMQNPLTRRSSYSIHSNGCQNPLTRWILLQHPFEWMLRAQEDIQGQKDTHNARLDK